MDAEIVTDAIAAAVMIGKFNANPTVDELAIGNKQRREGEVGDIVVFAHVDVGFVVGPGGKRVDMAVGDAKHGGKERTGGDDGMGGSLVVTEDGRLAVYLKLVKQFQLSTPLDCGNFVIGAIDTVSLLGLALDFGHDQPPHLKHLRHDLRQQFMGVDLIEKKATDDVDSGTVVFLIDGIDHLERVLGGGILVAYRTDDVDVFQRHEMDVI